MDLKRFIIYDKVTGEWAGSVFAEAFKHWPDSYTARGILGGNFTIGTRVIAQADLRKFAVSDSGGRMAVEMVAGILDVGIPEKCYG